MDNKYLRHNNKLIRWNDSYTQMDISEPVGPTYPTTGCILACDFNNDLIDDINNNTGSWSSSASYDATGFKNGNGCLDYSGTTNTTNASFPYISAYGAFHDEFSISFWFWNDYYSSGDTYQWQYIWSYGSGHSPPGGISIQRYEHQEKFQFEIYNNQEFQQSSTWADKTWEHYIFTGNKTNGTMYMYKNNAGAGSISGRSFTGTGTNDIVYGSNSILSKIGPTRCYNRVLTLDERTELYEEFD